MALRRQPTLSPLRWFAWCVSLAIHAGLLASMFYWLRFPDVRKTDDVQFSSVNFVLPVWDEEVSEPVDEADQALDVADIRQELEIDDGQTAVLPAVPAVAPREAVLVDIPKTTLQQNTRTETSTGKDEGGSGRATLRVFGNEAQGSKFVFLFDRSISMEGAPLEAAKSQLVAGLATLKDAHEFQIVFFNYEPETWNYPVGKPELVAATQAHQQLAKEFVRSISASGGTYRRSALLQALELQADVIFFLTDADAPMAGNDVLEAIRLARGQHTAIHTIEFGAVPYPTRENFLVKLARNTGGRYVYLNMDELERTRE